jgi:hypothetical protein
MAPAQSVEALDQAPATQFVAWERIRVMVCAGKLADANVPVHVPAMFTTGPIGAEIDVDAVGADALQLVSAPTSDSGTTKAR